MKIHLIVIITLLAVLGTIYLTIKGAMYLIDSFGIEGLIPVGVLAIVALYYLLFKEAEKEF